MIKTASNTKDRYTREYHFDVNWDIDGDDVTVEVVSRGLYIPPSWNDPAEYPDWKIVSAVFSETDRDLNPEQLTELYNSGMFEGAVIDKVIENWYGDERDPY